MALYRPIYDLSANKNPNGQISEYRFSRQIIIGRYLNWQIQKNLYRLYSIYNSLRVWFKLAILSLVGETIELKPCVDKSISCKAPKGPKSRIPTGNPQS